MFCSHSRSSSAKSLPSERGTRSPPCAAKGNGPAAYRHWVMTPTGTPPSWLSIPTRRNRIVALIPTQLDCVPGSPLVDRRRFRPGRSGRAAPGSRLLGDDHLGQRCFRLGALQIPPPLRTELVWLAFIRKITVWDGSR